MKLRYVLPLIALALATPAAAQTAGKVLTQADYDIWRSIQGATLSNDGGWATWTVQPLVGEGELVVRNTKTGVEYRHTRGFTGRPPGPGIPGGGNAEVNEEDEPRGNGPAPARFTADSKYLLFIVQPSRAEVERMEAERKQAAGRGRRGGASRAQERNTLAIMNLANGQVTDIDGVRSFDLARKSGRFVAYTLQPDSVAQPAGAAGGRGQNAQGDSAQAPTKNRKSFGNTMVLRELATGQETRVDDVQSIDFNEDGSQLAYVVSSRATPASDGLFMRSLSDGKVATVLSGVGNYRQVTFDRDGKQIAFTSDRDTYATSDDPDFKLYLASVKAPAARAVVTTSQVGMDGVADRGQLSFTRDGSAITFALAPVIPDSIPADSLGTKAVYDLWHWQDPRLQSQQQLSLSRDRARTFTGIYHIASNKVVQLTDEEFPQVTLSDDGRTALQNSNTAYAIESMWGEGGTDIYLTDATTGTRKLLHRKGRTGGTLSPGAKYVAWFDDGHWYSHSVATGKTVDLTTPIAGVHFEDESMDRPDEAGPYGIAGWTKNDASVLVYDKWDVWEIDPAGARAPRVVTDSAGRKSKTSFRVVDLDREDRFIDPAQPLLLRAMDDQSKASGFWQDRLGANAQPVKIVMADRNMGNPQKAQDADTYMLTESTFRDFPNLYVGTKLDALTKISDANPQQKDYRWGTVEIVDWRDADGVPARGLLYKPDNFDPSRKYPMMVYFYEQHTNGLHGYATPTGRNVINPTVYVSRGYMVFEPDIRYVDGHPGQSALKTIVPGVQSLMAKGFVKEDGVGIQGQSWGGYQTAYIITQTNLFRAAMAGAPVSNMFSAYGGIRLESGNSRAGQYEHGQSRIGGSIWEYPELYMENSPLFYADRIETPLLIMSNDADGAVPFQQGIEMFIAMRRLGKEAYLVDYNGDAHNPRKRANQRDIDIKMQQFFDHHLLGAPMPDWMKNGIPMLQKGRDQIVSPPEPVSSGSGGGG